MERMVPGQALIDAAQSYADGVVARSRGGLTKDGGAKMASRHIALEAEAAIADKKLLETITKRMNDAEAQGRLGEWLDERLYSDVGLNLMRRDILLEIIAIALERGELPPSHCVSMPPKSCATSSKITCAARYCIATAASPVC